MPLAVSLPFSLSMSWIGPDATQSEGELMAARSSASLSSARSAASGRRTASIAPGARFCMIFARVATSRQPSSNERTPARQAATNSPTLWPTIAVGLRPQDIQSFASAYSNMNNAGCASRVALPLAAEGSSNSARSPGPTTGSAIARPSSIVDLNEACSR